MEIVDSPESVLRRRNRSATVAVRDLRSFRSKSFRSYGLHRIGERLRLAVTR